jgi:hypothetical protein
MNEVEKEELETLAAKYFAFKTAYLTCRPSVQTQFLGDLKFNNERLANQLQATVIRMSVKKRLPRRVG